MLMMFLTFSCLVLVFFFFKQKTAYEMRISDWSSDVCSSDLTHPLRIRVEEGLAKMALDLQHDPEVKAKVAKVRDELLEKKAVKRWLDGLWEIGRASCRGRVCQYV